MSWTDRASIERVSESVALARQAGWWTDDSTRLLIHDLSALEHKLALLKSAFPDDAVHGIAIKANPLVEVLKVVVQAGCGLEAASWEEATCAMAAGCPPERLILDSPAKTPGELAQALTAGLWINTDSESELARIAAMDQGAARIGLRVNPQIGAGRIAATSTVGKGSKFGEPLSRAAELKERFPFLSGLHVHTGSQGCGLELLQAAAQATSEVVERLDLDWLDVGGGLPVRYTDADPEPPTVQDWAQGLSALPSWGRRTLLTELGRSVQAPCGWALTRIESVKEVDGRPLYIVHLGADFLLRRVYRPGDWDHEFWVLKPDGTPREGAVEADIGGPLCFSGDLLARRRVLPQAQPGDLLVIRDVGAYTLSMWSRHCSRGLPPVLGLREDRAQPLYRGETPEQVARFWSL